jgi:dTDP-4-dehydrorhamnose reductase
MSDSKTIAILGGHGMLGTDLAAACQTRGYQVKTYDLPEFDITSDQQCARVLSESDIIVNCAAYTNVDGAESSQALAHQVNAEAVGHLGTLVREHGKWLLHISTDFVFDGQLDRPYVEADTPNPISEYGKSKLAGETRLTESNCSHAIVRVQWTYGSHGDNFVTKLLQRAQTNPELRVVDDQVGSPTATIEVARALCDLVDQQARGLYHYASTGYVSRYDMATYIVDHLGLDVTVSPCKTSDFKSPAQRPLNSRFCCDKVAALLNTPIESWQASLQIFLEQL